MEHSPFDRLPAELRNEIYKLVLRQSEPFTITWTKKRGVSKKEKLRVEKSEPAKLHPLALLFTCRVTNAETSKLFYAINTFRFRQGADLIRTFKTQIGRNNAASLTSVTGLRTIELIRWSSHRSSWLSDTTWWLWDTICSAREAGKGVIVELSLTEAGRRLTKPFAIDVDRAQESLRQAIRRIEGERVALAIRIPSPRSYVTLIKQLSHPGAYERPSDLKKIQGFMTRVLKELQDREKMRLTDEKRSLWSLRQDEDRQSGLGMWAPEVGIRIPQPSPKQQRGRCSCIRRPPVRATKTSSKQQLGLPV